MSEDLEKNEKRKKEYEKRESKRVRSNKGERTILFYLYILATYSKF